MRATFANQLVFAEPGREDTIKFRHPLRVSADMFIRFEPTGENQWGVFYRGQRMNDVGPQVRDMLLREFRTYIRLRIKKNIHALSYKDFVELAKVANIG